MSQSIPKQPYKKLPVYHFLVALQIIFIVLCVVMVLVPLIAYLGYIAPNMQQGLAISTVDNDGWRSNIVNEPTAVVYDKGANLSMLSSDDLIIYTDTNTSGRTVYYVVKFLNLDTEAGTMQVSDGTITSTILLDQFYAKVISTHYNVGEIIELFYGNFFWIMLILFLALLLLVINITNIVKKNNTDPAQPKNDLTTQKL